MKFSFIAAAVFCLASAFAGAQNLPTVALPQANLPAPKVSVTLANAWHAYGDSITCGYTLGDANCPLYSTTTTPSANSYPSLIQARTSLQVANYGITGAQACEVFVSEMYAPAKGNNELWQMGQSPVFSLSIGTNDADVKGAGAYEANFNNCHLAMIEWLMTPAENKILPGNTAVSTTGAFSNAANPTYAGGWFANAAGTLTVPVTTYGNPVYVHYYMNDAVAAGSGFTYQVDGGAASALVSTRPATALAMQSGATTGVGAIRIPALSAGAHTITITTTTGAISVVGVSTAPTLTTAGRPTILVSDIPVNNVASAVTQQQYTADIAANVSLLQADGADVRFVNTHPYFGGTPAEATDGLHPSILGHQHLLQAYMQVAQVTPSGASASVQGQVLTPYGLNLGQNAYVASPNYKRGAVYYEDTAGAYRDGVQVQNGPLVQHYVDRAGSGWDWAVCPYGTPTTCTEVASLTGNGNFAARTGHFGTTPAAFAGVSLFNAGATQVQYNAAGGIDAKTWDTYIAGNLLTFRAVNDANTAAFSWMGVTRTGMTVTNVTFGVPLYISQILPSGTGPTIAAGTAAGTSPTVSVSGFDMDHRLTITTGTATTASATLATISFGTAYLVTPQGCSLQPTNASASSQVSTVFPAYPASYGYTINVGTTALPANTTLTYSVHCE